MSVKYSKFLIQESPLTLSPTLACVLTLHKAIILQQIQYLLQIKQGGKIIEGEKYIWNTAEQFSTDHFPFMKPDTIRKHLRELELEGFLICKKPNSSDGNMTKYYRIDYNCLNKAIEVWELEQPDQPEKDAASNRQDFPDQEPAQNSESLKGNTKITTKITERENIKPKLSQSTLKKFPKDFLVTSKMISWASAECPLVDVDSSTQKFKNRKKNKKSDDWVSDWELWIIREQQYNKENQLKPKEKSQGQLYAETYGMFKGTVD